MYKVYTPNGDFDTFSQAMRGLNITAHRLKTLLSMESSGYTSPEWAYQNPDMVQHFRKIQPRGRRVRMPGSAQNNPVQTRLAGGQTHQQSGGLLTEMNQIMSDIVSARNDLQAWRDMGQDIQDRMDNALARLQRLI